MSRCNPTRLTEYMDGRLPLADVRALQAHLSDCAACRGRMASWNSTRAMLRDLPRTPVPPRVRETIDARRARQMGPQPGRSALPVLAAAASIAVVAIVTLAAVAIERAAAPPTVVAVRAMDAFPINVPERATIVVEFDTPFDPGTVRETLRIEPAVVASIELQDNRVVITPREPLQPATTYIVRAEPQPSPPVNATPPPVAAFQTAPRVTPRPPPDTRSPALAPAVHSSPTPHAPAATAPTPTPAAAAVAAARTGTPAPGLGAPAAAETPAPTRTATPATATATTSASPAPTRTGTPGPSATATPSVTATATVARSTPQATATPASGVPATPVATGVPTPSSVATPVATPPATPTIAPTPTASACRIEAERVLRGLGVVSTPIAERLGCTTREAGVTSGLAQDLERGFLLWRATPSQVIVFRGITAGTWAIEPDSGRPAELAPGDTPPGGLQAPAARLLRAWLDVARDVGWARGGPRSFGLRDQPFERGTVLVLDSATLVLYADGRWETAR